MPFNGQLEMFDEQLLIAAIQLSHDLDDSFEKAHKKTMSQVRKNRQVHGWQNPRSNIAAALVDVRGVSMTNC